MSLLISRLAPLLLGVVLAFAPPSAAPSRAADNTGGGLPLPRFASLRSDESYLRSGPGTRYPVDWIYTRRELPVEVIAEFDVWRKIRDWQGTEGWVHQSLLQSRRMVVVIGIPRRLRADPDDSSPAVATVDPDVIARLVTCPHAQSFCKLEIQNYQGQNYAGWLKRDEFWGVYPGEFIE